MRFSGHLTTLTGAYSVVIYAFFTKCCMCRWEHEAGITNYRLWKEEFEDREEHKAAMEHLRSTPTSKASTHIS